MGTSQMADVSAPGRAGAMDGGRCPMAAVPATDVIHPGIMAEADGWAWEVPLILGGEVHRIRVELMSRHAAMTRGDLAGSVKLPCGLFVIALTVA